MNKEQEDLLISWLALIGAITLFWSPIERSIDQIVSILCKSQNKNKQKKRPKTLSHKLNYIESNIQNDIVSQNELKSLIKSTKQTAQIRNVCVHGMLQEFDENSIQIGKVEGKSEEHLIEIFTIDRARFDKSANQMTTLSRAWGTLAEKIVKKEIAK
ncbi:MAG: hypothetical protein AB7D43_09795 [Sulfurimonadaceae bacterium]